MNLHLDQLFSLSWKTLLSGKTERGLKAISR